MNEEIKARWVTALRSGKYKQAIGMLRSKDDGFCCLGVLCELAVDEGVIEPAVPSTGGVYYNYDGGASAFLPSKVMEWAGLDSVSPVYQAPTGRYSLSSLNDKGTPFNQVADRIEECL